MFQRYENIPFRRKAAGQKGSKEFAASLRQPKPPVPRPENQQLRSLAAAGYGASGAGSTDEDHRTLRAAAARGPVPYIDARRTGQEGSGPPTCICRDREPVIPTTPGIGACPFQNRICLSGLSVRYRHRSDSRLPPASARLGLASTLRLSAQPPCQSSRRGAGRSARRDSIRRDR